MAKHPKSRRRSSRFQVIKFNANRALTTLADTVVVSQVLTALSQDFFAIAADCRWAIRGLTAGEGPLNVGYHNSDLSVTEITESLDASPTSESDIIARERTRRPVRSAGTFSGATTEEVLNNGKPIRTKLRFNLANSLEVSAFIRNESGAPLSTGAVVEMQGKIYGHWR